MLIFMWKWFKFKYDFYWSDIHVCIVDNYTLLQRQVIWSNGLLGVFFIIIACIIMLSVRYPHWHYVKITQSSNSNKFTCIV